jgi:twitching motility protein PilU
MSQRLVMTREGTRTAAIEIMINTPHISELIRKGDIVGMKEAIRASSERGVQSFDQALLKLYQDEVINIEEALANADSRTNLEAKINFG